MVNRLRLAKFLDFWDSRYKRILIYLKILQLSTNYLIRHIFCYVENLRLDV